jgi:large subunit ribosomal protein L35
MGKLKTKKGVAKRYKLSKKGKVKYFSGGKSHLATNKDSKRVRNLRRSKTIDHKKFTNFLKSMLPYG